MNDEGRTTKDGEPRALVVRRRSLVTVSPFHRVRRVGLWLIGRLYPQPRPPGAGPRSLLLIRPDHLGDVLFLTPALHALRSRLPETKITLLVGPWGQAAIAGNPDVDAVVICPFPGFERRGRRGGFPVVSASCPRKSGQRIAETVAWMRRRGGFPIVSASCPRKPGQRIAETIAWMRENPPLRMAPYRQLFATARQLRAGGYDAAVVLRFDHWWGAWLAAAAGIPRRIGYDWPETRPFLTQAVPYRADRHEVVQNAGLLATLAAAPPAPRLRGEWAAPQDWGDGGPLGPVRFAVTQADREWAATWLIAHGADPARPLCAIHPGAGAAVKQWPPAAWAEAANRLAPVLSVVGGTRLGAVILLTGAATERSLTAAIAARLSVPALDAAGQTTLGQLAALYECCAIVLGSDSGPLHLAAAAGAPTVHLYGPVDPAKFGPWGDPARHAVLTTPWPCAPCNRLDWPAEALPQHACMAAIAVEDVVRAACCVMRDA
ncbi:MAG: glycosyltransferase family 9 protein [Chloroflexi bacterium]|nr:glycosyltransferase family 9 protein [Chloroflexota bacterium]